MASDNGDGDPGIVGVLALAAVLIIAAVAIIVSSGCVDAPNVRLLDEQGVKQIVQAVSDYTKSNPVATTEENPWMKLLVAIAGFAASVVTFMESRKFLRDRRNRKEGMAVKEVDPQK